MFKLYAFFCFLVLLEVLPPLTSLSLTSLSLTSLSLTSLSLSFQDQEVPGVQERVVSVSGTLPQCRRAIEMVVDALSESPEGFTYANVSTAYNTAYGYDAAFDGARPYGDVSTVYIFAFVYCTFYHLLCFGLEQFLLH